MTDNEIIKALESAIEYRCGHYIEIDAPTIKNALDLINQQKKELGYQSLYWGSYWKDVFEAGMEKLKAETIKAFADDLMARAYLSSNWSNGERTYVVEVKDIDNLAKERIGEQ